MLALSVDIEIIPLGSKSTWGAVLDRWRSVLSDESSCLLGPSPVLRRLGSDIPVDVGEELGPDMSAYFDLATGNTIGLNISENYPDTSEHEYIRDFGGSLVGVDLDDIALRWAANGYSFEISSHGGRSEREPELFLALAVALAEATSGLVVILHTSGITLDVGAYTPSEFRKASWVSKPVVPFGTSMTQDGVTISVDTNGDFYEVTQRRRFAAARLEEHRRIQSLGDKEDIVQIHVLPLGEPAQWRAVRERWRDSLPDDGKRLLGASPTLWKVMGLQDVEEQEHILHTSTMMLDLKTENEISISVFNELGDLLEMCRFNDDSNKLNNHDMNQLIPLWANRGYFLCVSSGSGRSGDEPGLVIALAVALAEGTAGLVVLPNSKHFTIAAGIYTPPQFREARWRDE